MISAPRGMLRIAALRLLADSSLSGSDLSEQINRLSSGEWAPSPGSIYFILKELLNEGLIIELPRRDGNIRRYIISNKGKEELSKLSRDIGKEVRKQLNLLSFYSMLCGRDDLGKKMLELAEEIRL